VLYSTYRKPSRNAITAAQIKAAFEAVKEAAAMAHPKTKRNADGDGEGRPAKRKRGAVDDASRRANEMALRPFFFDHRKLKLVLEHDDDD
jgi:hypothetical protein